MVVARQNHLTDKTEIAAIVISMGNAGYSKKAIFDKLLQDYLVDLDLLAEAVSSYPFQVAQEVVAAEPVNEEPYKAILARKWLQSMANEYQTEWFANA